MTEEIKAVETQPQQNLEAILAGLADRIEKRLDAQDEAIKAVANQPATDPGVAVEKKAPVQAKFGNIKRYDNMSAPDIALMIGVLNSAGRPVSEDAYKAAAVRLIDDSARGVEGEYVKEGVKAMQRVNIPLDAVKANELNYSTQASYGDEWVVVAYSSNLWESIRLTSNIVNRVPSIEIPQGYESIIIPLERPTRLSTKSLRQPHRQPTPAQSPAHSPPASWEPLRSN